MCKPNISQRGFHQLSRDTKLDVSYRYLIPVTERQPEELDQVLSRKYLILSQDFGLWRFALHQLGVSRVFPEGDSRTLLWSFVVYVTS